MILLFYCVFVIVSYSTIIIFCVYKCVFSSFSDNSGVVGSICLLQLCHFCFAECKGTFFFEIKNVFRDNFVF